MLRFLFLLFLLQVNSAHCQRIFSAAGALASFLDMKSTDLNDVTSSNFPTGIIRPSVSIGFETSQWKRFSLSTTGTYFTSGGSRSQQSTFNSNQMLFDNVCLGVSGNYYIVDSKLQFYVGLGPRMDYFRSQEAVYRELMGDNYQYQTVSVIKVGITGSIGVNFQLGDVSLGLKSNYYYRPVLLNTNLSTYPNHWGLTNDYKNITIRDCVFDLQLVLGYRFGNKGELSR